MQKTQFQAAALVVAVLGGVSVAQAATIFDPTDAGLILSNTVADTDLLFLSQFVGAFPGQTLSFTTTGSSTGFSESLTGMYGGSSLNIAYTATVDQAAPSGTIIALHSTGTYGSSSESSGYNTTFQYLDNTGTTFQVGMNGFFIVGANTADLGLTITGENNAGLYTYTDTSGSLTINGSIFSIPSGMGLVLNLGPVVGPAPLPIDGWVCPETPVHGCFPIFSSWDSFFFNAAQDIFEGTATVVITPEPASAILMLTGLGWLTRKRIAHGLR
jgi:hypothetical protein